jgi:hypothetical protein
MLYKFTDQRLGRRAKRRNMEIRLNLSSMGDSEDIYVDITGEQ